MSDKALDAACFELEDALAGVGDGINSDSAKIALPSAISAYLAELREDVPGLLHDIGRGLDFMRGLEGHYRNIKASSDAIECITLAQTTLLRASETITGLKARIAALEKAGQAVVSTLGAGDWLDRERPKKLVRELGNVIAGKPASAADAPRVPTCDDLRADGWAVAVHNDYRLHGEPHTFWLFTKGSLAVKGEGRTDVEALDQVRKAISELEAHAAGGEKVQSAGTASEPTNALDDRNERINSVLDAARQIDDVGMNVHALPDLLEKLRAALGDLPKDSV